MIKNKLCILINAKIIIIYMWKLENMDWRKNTKIEHSGKIVKLGNKRAKAFQSHITSRQWWQLCGKLQRTLRSIPGYSKTGRHQLRISRQPFQFFVSFHFIIAKLVCNPGQFRIAEVCMCVSSVFRGISTSV
jgi:hypothetical protein